jgi:hypothetical protein
MTAEPTRLFAEPQPGPREDDIGPQLVQTARAIATICATRLLLLIATLGGAGMWAFTIYDPQRERLYAAVAFSLVFVLPLVALYWKRG